MKKLTRSSKNKMVAGIIGGLGEYFNIDPVLLRVAFIFFVLVTGFFPGILAYIIALFIIPMDTEPVQSSETKHTIYDEQKADQ